MSNQPPHPESHMMTHGYNPDWSEGSLKVPIFQTSTFAFKTAEDGKRFFELQTGKRKLEEGETPGLIYSRMNNPNLEILERRLVLYEKGAEAACVFESGMAAISTMLLEFLKPGDLLLHSNPLYGGSDGFIYQVLPRFGIEILGFKPTDTKEEIIARVEATGKADRLTFMYIETPANPNNILIDIALCVEVAQHFSSPTKKVITACDNTFMGPIWQSPLEMGVDFTVYSATKYLGGHSDIIAGVCMGSTVGIQRVRKLRSHFGGMSGPHTAWLMLRSLETLQLRMDRQCQTAQVIAQYLRKHEKVESVYYFDQFADPRQEAIYKNQCKAPGAMISFDIKGGEAACFAFLNQLKLIKLAVSLGSTESLAQHPYTMTHANVDEAVKREYNITDKLIRFSVGVEHPDDLIEDLERALGNV